MYELYPYLTNDGSIGLYSAFADDIYHSTYGALSESWQKFTLPARLNEYIETHSSVKILDICYGIGYNTKTALSTFIENSQKKIKNIEKKSTPLNLNIASIDTDNISSRLDEKFTDKNQKNSQENSNCIDALDADNILRDFNELNCTNHVELKKKIIIDAIDSDKILIGLSPFIKLKTKNNKLFFKNPKNKFYQKNKFAQIQKIKNSKQITLPKEYRLKNEVQIILLLKLLEKNNELFMSPVLQSILKNKNYIPYLSKFMLNLKDFCVNSGYKLPSEALNSSFLHNIYYRYLSKSYKSTLNLLKNFDFDLNFHCQDAREYIYNCEQKYNFIFLDAFTPAKCPSLWTLDFMQLLYEHLEDDGMVLTYSSSAAVRNAFIKSGFYVGKIFDSKSKKFVGTIAAKNPKDIFHELSQKDLDLIHSKSGICFRDKNLNMCNEDIIAVRSKEIDSSDLVSSSTVMKGYDK